MAVSVDTVFEEREQSMVSLNGGNPNFRLAHFLKPTFTSTEDLLPPPPLSDKTCLSELQRNPVNVMFRGRPCSRKKWKAWVYFLLPIHRDLWQKAGILEPILASTYRTLRDKGLVTGLAERWCVETNTFVFPWGEATITLEDMMVLEGYSVLGDPVSNPLKNDKELVEIEHQLKKAIEEIRISHAKRVTHHSWMNYFMKSGSPLEHEAFLVFWLLSFVLTGNDYYIAEHVFPVAINLSRGTQIALAPAVLASIYSDLSLLKRKMFRSAKLGSEYCRKRKTINLGAPIELVQIWAWERFPHLRPMPKSIDFGIPRSARWHELKSLDFGDIREAIDSAGECFMWRPYATFSRNLAPSGKFYRDNEEWILVESNMDRELESYVRVLRVSELVGVKCIQQYLPHRVAMQFGLDQDLPGHVTRFNQSPQIAWQNYIRPIRDEKLYIPHRFFESDVTPRYLEWWKESRRTRLVQVSERKKKCKETSILPHFPSERNQVEAENPDEGDELPVAEIFSPEKSILACHDERSSNNHFQGSSSSAADKGVRRRESLIDESEQVVERSGVRKGKNQLKTADKDEENCSNYKIPGLEQMSHGNKKCEVVEVVDSEEEDGLTIVEMFSPTKVKSVVHVKPPPLNTRFQGSSSSAADKGVVKMKSPTETEQLVELSGASKGNIQLKGMDTNDEKGRSYNGNNTSGLDFEVRVNKLEILVAHIKRSKTLQRL